MELTNPGPTVAVKGLTFELNAFQLMGETWEETPVAFAP